MSDRLLRESDVLRIAFQLPLVVNSAFADAVKALPSADRWIPCSERLPSEQGQYLVTTYACDDYYYVDILSFHKGEFYSTDSEWGDMVDNDVLAWMPLPEPWKGADDE